MSLLSFPFEFSEPLSRTSFEALQAYTCPAGRKALLLICFHGQAYNRTAGSDQVIATLAIKNFNFLDYANPGDSFTFSKSVTGTSTSQTFQMSYTKNGTTRESRPYSYTGSNLQSPILEVTYQVLEYPL